METLYQTVDRSGISIPLELIRAYGLPEGTRDRDFAAKGRHLRHARRSQRRRNRESGATLLAQERRRRCRRRRAPTCRDGRLVGAGGRYRHR